MKTNPNEPINLNGQGYWNDEMNKTHGGVGLTKREYFASQIIAGDLASQSEEVGIVTANYSSHLGQARRAVSLADALIEALNETPTPQKDGE
jgi:hypothetical protein